VIFHLLEEPVPSLAGSITPGFVIPAGARAAAAAEGSSAITPRPGGQKAHKVINAAYFSAPRFSHLSRITRDLQMLSSGFRY
jgi:hypothetical protein